MKWRRFFGWKWKLYFVPVWSADGGNIGERRVPFTWWRARGHGEIGWVGRLFWFGLKAVRTDFWKCRCPEGNWNGPGVRICTTCDTHRPFGFLRRP